MVKTRTVPGIIRQSSLPFDVPKGAVAWSIERFNGGGDKMSHARADGIGVYEWPLAELQIATVRARWGEGDYTIRCYGPKRDGKNTLLGRRRLTVLPLSTEERPKKKKLRTVIPLGGGSSDLATLLALQEGADQRAHASLLETREFMQNGQASLFTMLGMVMGLRTEEARGNNAHAAARQRATDAENAELRARIEALEAEDEEDEEEEEEEEAAAAATEESPKTAREAINRVGVTVVEKGIPAVAGFVGGVLEKIAEKTTQKDPPTPPITTAPTT